MRPFNLIIGRYNELGLKSDKVRARMERRLLTYIEKIALREGLHVLQAKRKWGRFLFEFPPDEIPRVLQVFEHIIGLHGYSPAFAVDKDFPTVVEAAVSFAREYFHHGDTFAVRARRIKPYPKTSTEIEREIGGLIHTDFEERKQPLIVNLTAPQKTLYIEIREKEAYLFIQKYATRWGGNPIEYDKAMVALWSGNPGDAVASQLLLRRGTVIIPLLLYGSGSESQSALSIITSSTQLESIQNQITALAKYYPEPLPFFTLNISPLQARITHDKFSPEVEITTLAYGEFLLLDKMLHALNQQRTLTYAEKTIWIKGLITSTRISDVVFSQAGQQLSVPHFMPLTGLSSAMIESMHAIIQKPPSTFTGDDYSQGFALSNVVLQNVEANYTQDVAQSAPSVDFDPIVAWYRQEEIGALMEKIIASALKDTVSGKIL
ncbi:MAG: THUMP domain-containing protein [Promethearchaeota archaeon]